MSGHLHGNPETARRDREIRTWLRNHGYEVIELAVSDLGDQDAMVRHFRRLAGHLRADALRDTVRSDTSWFDRAGAEPDKEPLGLRIVQPRPQERYVNCLPLIPLKIAAGSFGDQHAKLNEEEWDWVEVETGRTLKEGMFVAQVVGHSMEPKIPDRSYCIFSRPVTGTRQGRTVLVALKDATDPETGERFTVKSYESQKAEAGEGSWRHVKITLRPLNAEYDPIELTSDSEDQVAVVAEFLEVLG